MNALIFIADFMNWTISIDTARLLPVQADFLNHDTGTPQRHQAHNAPPLRQPRNQPKLSPKAASM
jgi:hypothetical protein